MAGATVWDEVLGTEHAVVVRTYIERWPRKGRPDEKVLIVVVEPEKREQCRCPRCGQRGKPVERDVRRWRTLDVHGRRCFLESAVPRVVCGEHGKITAAVPRARHDDAFSRPLEAHAAWLAGRMPWSQAARELRVSWDAVAGITARVAADAARGADRLGGLRRIGIDEKSWGRRGDQYLTVVTGHDGRRVAWAAEGRCQDVVRAFFTELGPGRAALLTQVPCDGADWIHEVVRAKAPQAGICLDPFHVVKWAGERLDEVRRRIAGELRAAGRDDQAGTLKGSMRALRKKPGDLTVNQRTTLAHLARDNGHLYKGYLIKEQLREAFRARGDDGKRLLRGVTAWALRSQIPEMVKLGKTLRRFHLLICHALDTGVTNGRAEALNSQVSALITRARGFRTADALISMIYFTHGGLCPESPWN